MVYWDSGAPLIASDQNYSAPSDPYNDHEPIDSSAAAMKMLARLVQREALVLTYNDLLLLIGGLFVFGLMLLPLVRRPHSFLSR